MIAEMPKGMPNEGDNESREEKIRRHGLPADATWADIAAAERDQVPGMKFPEDEGRQAA